MSRFRGTVLFPTTTFSCVSSLCFARTRARRSSFTVASGTTDPEWPLPPIEWPNRVGPRRKRRRRWKHTDFHWPITSFVRACRLTKRVFPGGSVPTLPSVLPHHPLPGSDNPDSPGSIPGLDSRARFQDKNKSIFSDDRSGNRSKGSLILAFNPDVFPQCDSCHIGL